MKNKEQIVILGAGLAGLSAALKLKSNYVLYEKRAIPGGLCETVEDDGYRFDRTGHLIHLSKPKVKRLVLDLIGDQLVQIQRRSRIFSNHVYTHYPFQANTYGLPTDIIAECLTGFAKAYAKRGGKRAEAADFEAFIYDNFGEGIAKHFMIPYNERLWGVHPREVTDKWCKRFVPTPDLESVVQGALAPPKDNIGYNASFYYPQTGIGALPDAMAKKVNDIKYRTAPKAIDFRKKRMNIKGEWIDYKACISSLPLDELCKLLVDPPQKIKKAAATLRCTSLRYLDVALNKPAGTDYHWTYVPEKKYPFYRVGSYSNFSQKTVPQGKGSLYVELASRSPIRLKSLMPKVEEGLMALGLIGQASDIAFVKPRQIKHAYVVYDSGHERAMKEILPWLEKNNIYSIGRYGKWEYAAMEDAIAQGFDAADQVKKIK